jgi:hypothetical protein
VIAQWYSSGVRAGCSEVRVPVVAGDFSLHHRVQTGFVGSTQPPIRWVPGALPLGVKRPAVEADLLPPSSAEVKECMHLYLHSPNTPSRRGAQFKKEAEGQLYLYLITHLHLVSRSRMSGAVPLLPNTSSWRSA